MRRFVFANGLAALLVAVTVGVVSGGAAHATFQCSGDITGQTINDSVLVVGRCFSSGDTHISRNLTTAPGASLSFRGSNNTIGGSAFLKNTGGLGAELTGTTIQGALYVEQNSGGQICLFPSLCRGTTPDTIIGSVYVAFNATSVAFQRVTVGQSVFIQHNSRNVVFSLSPSVGGSVYATANNAGGEVDNNRIAGNLIAQQNSPAYTVFGNAVGGTCNNNGTHTC